MEAINSLAGSAGIIVFGPSNGGEVSHPKSGEDTSSKITSTFSHSSLQKDSWRPASGTIQTESQNSEQKLCTSWCKEQACAVETGAEDSLDNPATSNGSPARHWCREHACDVAHLAHSSHSHHLSSDSWWKVNTLEVVEMARALPACGNALPVLCGAMRSLLTSQAMLLDRHTREEIVQWADDIYQKGELSVSIKLENSKTTLGLVLFDDVVEIVLPGGPAFRAGLQKGDSILTVDGKEPEWNYALKSSEILHEALSQSDDVGDKVELVFRRNGTVRQATLVRMSVKRVMSIRDWMELQALNASHALKKQDTDAVKYSSEMLQGMVQILKQQMDHEDMMTERIYQLTTFCKMIVDAGSELLDRCDWEIGQEAEAMTTQIERLQRVLARTAIARWRNKAIGKAWSKWCDAVRQNHVMVNMTRRWKHALVRRSWMAWKWIILETSEANASEIERLKRVLARAAIARWRNKAVGKAWSKWCEAVRQNRWLRSIVEKVARRWMHRVVAQAWNTWYADLLERKRLRHLTSRALSMWRNQVTSQAWNSWCADHLEQKRLRHLTSRTLSMWRNRELAMGMDKWQGEVLRSRKALKAVQMWRNRALGMAWSTWKALVARLRRLRFIVTKVAFRWINRVMSQAWNSWCEAFLEKKRLKHLTSRALSLWRNRELAMTMGKWWGEVLRTRKAVKVLKTLIHRTMGKACNTWKAMVKETRRLRSIVEKVARRWMHRVVAQAWNTWYADLLEQKRLRHLTSRALSMWRNQVTSQAWNSWCADHLEQKRLRHHALHEKMDLIQGHNDTLLKSISEAESRLQDSKREVMEKESYIKELTWMKDHNNTLVKSLFEAESRLEELKRENMEKEKHVKKLDSLPRAILQHPEKNTPTDHKQMEKATEDSDFLKESFAALQRRVDELEREKTLRGSYIPQIKPNDCEGGFVGLQVSETPPHLVKQVDDFVDINFVRHDAPGYLNDRIIPGDRILQIDGKDAQHTDLQSLRDMLKGPLHSTVTIKLSRVDTGENYNVVALRHGFRAFGRDVCNDQGISSPVQRSISPRERVTSTESELLVSTPRGRVHSPGDALLLNASSSSLSAIGRLAGY